MSTLFVTGSGTDVGKTFVAELLLGQLLRAGRRACALKPVASGFDEEAPATSDPGRLLRAQGLEPDPRAIEAICPWRFAAPLSPDMAAAREGRAVDFDALVAFCRRPRNADVTLIEGIGGVMVPLDREHTVLDWIVAVAAPVMLVAGTYLGTLSHTLTAAGMLAARGAALMGVVVDESPQQPVTPDETAAVLRRFVAPTKVVVVPRVTTDPARADAGARRDSARAAAELVALLDSW